MMPSHLSATAVLQVKTVSFATLAALLCGLFGCAAKSEFPSYRTATALASDSSLSPAETRSIDKMSVEELLQRGELALNEGNGQLAQVHFGAALEKAPESLAALLGLAKATHKTGDRRLARQLVEEALTRDPLLTAALGLRGRILRDQGELEAATADFRRVLESAPQDVMTLTDLAGICDRSPAKLAEAEELYRKVVELAPTSAVARNNLGFNCLLQGRYAEAVRILSEAFALDLDNPRILHNLAAAQLLAGEENKALQLFRKKLGAAEAYNNVGYLYMTQGNWDKAEASYKKAMELNPRFYVRADANLQTLYQLQSRAVRTAPQTTP